MGLFLGFSEIPTCRLLIIHDLSALKVKKHGPKADDKFNILILLTFFYATEIGNRMKDLRFCHITGFIPIFFHIISTDFVEKMLSFIFLFNPDDKNKKIKDLS
jgi:hypothetical protein